VSLNAPKDSPPDEAYDVSHPKGTLVRDMSYVAAGGYPFRPYNGIDVCIHNLVNINNSERVTEEAHYCCYSKTDCTG